MLPVHLLGSVIVLAPEYGEIEFKYWLLQVRSKQGFVNP